MSDIHLGAHPSVPEMEKREMEIFKEAIKKCISLNLKTSFSLMVLVDLKLSSSSKLLISFPCGVL